MIWKKQKGIILQGNFFLFNEIFVKRQNFSYWPVDFTLPPPFYSIILYGKALIFALLMIKLNEWRRSHPSLEGWNPLFTFYLPFLLLTTPLISLSPSSLFLFIPTIPIPLPFYSLSYPPFLSLFLLSSPYLFSFLSSFPLPSSFLLYPPFLLSPIFVKYLDYNFISVILSFLK